MGDDGVLLGGCDGVVLGACDGVLVGRCDSGIEGATGVGVTLVRVEGAAGCCTSSLGCGGDVVIAAEETCGERHCMR